MKVSNPAVESLAAYVRGTLNTLIPAGKTVAHIWYEESLNFGDSAIWGGQVDFLRISGIIPVYECSDKNYDEQAMRNSLGANGVILLRGGGNFGDLYGYHALRLKILQAFPATPIIQLPQTAKFLTAESVQKTREVILGHNDITLLARDQMTLDLFKTHFSGPNVRIQLCPDMALVSGGYSRLSEPTVDIVALLRTDRESNYHLNKGKVYSREIEEGLKISYVRKYNSLVYNTDNKKVVIENTVLTDKDQEIELTDWYLCNLVSQYEHHYHGLGYTIKARMGVMAALIILSRGRVVVTDRLHGYILALQLGIPHVLVDNSYGKLSAFYNTWGRESRLTYFSASIQDAFEQARILAQL